MESVRRIDLRSVGERLSPLHPGGCVEQFLGRGDGGRGTFAGDSSAELTSPFQGFSFLDELVGETEGDGALAVEALGIQQESAGDVAGDPAGEEGQHQGRNIADGDLGVGEARAGFRHHEIAGGGETAATADSGAVDRRDGEFGMAEKYFKELSQRLRVPPEAFGVAPGRYLLQRRQIGAGGEMAAGAGENDHPDLGRIRG